MKLEFVARTKLHKSTLRKFWAVVLINLFVLPVFGQKVSLTGVVKSGTDNTPLVGVTVRIKDKTIGTITNSEGIYSLEVEKGQTLVFSFTGYKTREIKIEGQRNVDVTLEEDAKFIEEVVIVGYGTMKRSDLTGAVVSVSAEDIKKTTATTLDQVLQGRAAGVQVTQNSGAPGGGISVNIRGINSLSGNEPLYVVDGVAIGGYTGGNSNALSSINPSDIASIEVLKDASATAIYGSRASNGVVLITTKHGQSGKTKISYEGYYALQQIPKMLDVLNLREYAEFQNLRAEVYGFGEREEFKDPSILGEGTNWQEEIFRTAPMYNHQISITGGNDKTKFAITGGYMDQDGIAIGSSFKRFTARVNMETQISQWLNIGLNSTAARIRQENTIDAANVIQTALNQTPDTPVKNPDGSYGVQAENMYGTYYGNPVADALLNENYKKETQVQFNAFTDINILAGLKFRMEYGGYISYSNTYQYTYGYDYGYFVQAASSSRSASNSLYTVFKTYFTYDKSFNKHSVNLMIGHEAQESKWESLSGSRDNYLFNNVHELDEGDASTATNSSSKNSSAIESYFARFNYNYDNRYFLTSTVRADGSSTFGPNNRWGYFPSLALAWKVNNEPFFKDVKTISNLKLRLGWGAVGNQSAGSYAYGSAMTASDGVWGTGFYVGNYSNANLKWETTSAYNTGLDVGLFNNRIELIVDAYYKKTKNLLMQASLPEYVTGVISSPYVNAGSIENKGIEFTLNTVNIDNKNFQWRTGITFSLNRNKIIDLYTETAGLQGKINGTQYSYTMAGEPAAQFYGYKVKGMFKTESDFYQKDSNGDFITDTNGDKVFVAIPEGKSVSEDEIWYGDFIFEDVYEDGVIDEKDRTFIGNPEPKFTFGITNSFSYKGFDLNIFLTGVYGNKVYNYLKEMNLDPRNNSGLLHEMVNVAIVEPIDPNGEYTLENMYVSNAETATVQRMTTSDANNNNRVSTRFVENGSYLRIKNISLGYTVPKSLTSRIGIENIRVYCNIQNAWTFTKYSGYDPEVGAYNQGVLTRGIDYARYPSQRIYTFGLNLTL